MDDLLFLIVNQSAKVKDLAQKSILLNESQCLHLINKLFMVVENIQNVVEEFSNHNVFQGSTMEDLYRVECKIEALIKDCTREDWVHASLWQMNNEEEFRELLEELKCNFGAFCDNFQSLDATKTSDLRELVDFNPIDVIEVEKDRKALENRLLTLKNTLTKDRPLAKYVYERLVCQLDGEGAELNAATLPLWHWAFKCSKPLGSGAYGQVYLTKCFGLDFAMKVSRKFDDEYKAIADANFKKEVGILAGLSHPNIIKFIGCGTKDNVNNNGGHFIVMEKMDKNLTDHCNQMGSQRSYLVAIDIMLQIASGIFYLHDMNVAHRDLKPDNILVGTMNCSKLKDLGYVLAKVADFGISKIEAKHIAEEPTCGKVGTTTYRAPETFKSQDDMISVNAYKSDVYSFAMLCSYVLTTVPPFSRHTSPLTIQERMVDGERPELPSNCPKHLAILIKNCWCLEPSRRPSFHDIYSNLCIIKRKLLQCPHDKYLICMSPRINDEGYYHLSPFSYLWIGLKMITNLMKTLMGFFWDDAHHVGNKYGDFEEEEFGNLPMEFCNTMKDKEKNPQKQVGIEYVGMEERRLRAMEVFKKHSIVVIVGMGGLGKTTLATTMMNCMGHKFDETSFMHMKSKTSVFKTMKEMLSNLGVKIDNVGNIAQGRKSLEEAFTKLDSFIVLDDIGTQVQVRELMDKKSVEFFKANKNNKMIITTRDWHLVECLGDVGRVDLDALNRDEGLKLFCIHAFPDQESGRPPSVVESLAITIVEACKGLPLSLEVVGASLCGVNRLRMWVRALQRLRRARSLGIGNDNQLWECLRISFDDLDKQDKDIFLDICCFFCKDLHPKGISKATALNIWSGVYKQPQKSLRRLEKKSLIKVHEHEILEVHDQLRDMGRMIVESDPNYIGTRWWNIQAATWNGEIQKDLRGMESMSMIGPTKDFKYHDVDRQLPQLRLFSYQGIEGLVSISNIVNQCDRLNGLILLCKQNRSFKRTSKTLPQIKWHQQRRLRVLMVEDSSTLLELPDDFENLRFLCELMLLDCHHLKQLPKTLGNLSSLATLNLSGCDGLKEIPDTLGSLSSLVNLNLSRCTRLKEIPYTLGKLASLENLDLTKCQGLKKVPKELGDLSSLSTLNLSWCKGLKDIPSSFSKLVSLNAFNLNHCQGLKELPKVLSNLTSLKFLDLNGCEGLKGIPEELGNMITLTTLDLSWCKGLKEIPKSLGNLTSLTTFHLNHCGGLHKIPEAFGNLTSLTSLDLNSCESLELVPKELGNLISLTILDLSWCTGLEEIPEALGMLASLTTLKLKCCQGLKYIPYKALGDLTSLTFLNLSGCKKLKKIPKTLGNLNSLITLDLSGCKSLNEIPEALGDLTSLITLDLSGCKGLREIPEAIGNLSSLTTLDLNHCKGLHKIPETINKLTSLTSLYLSGCESLKMVPKMLGNLISLTVLDLSWCTSLEEIPEALSNLSSLTTLNLDKCLALKEIPEALRRKKKKEK